MTIQGRTGFKLADRNEEIAISCRFCCKGKPIGVGTGGGGGAGELESPQNFKIRTNNRMTLLY